MALGRISTTNRSKVELEISVAVLYKILVKFSLWSYLFWTARANGIPYKEFYKFYYRSKNMGKTS